MSYTLKSLLWNKHEPGAHETLIRMHEYKRPDRSKAEAQFIADWITPLSPVVDAEGNQIIRVGTGSPHVLWSAHTDTVHDEDGYQHLTLVDSNLRLTKKERKRQKHGCLGADDTVGVWLMREMILADRPGLYIFHRGEERMGRGSGHIAGITPRLLSGITCAIAFDRRGFGSVITHQLGGRCCSDAFAISLANEIGLGMKPDAGGTFTDTAHYMRLVPECSNISVGYSGAHSVEETLDLGFAMKLRDAMLRVDADQLVIERDPKSYPSWTDCYDHVDHKSYGLVRSTNGPRSPRTILDDDFLWTAAMPEIVECFADEVSDILEHCGFDEETLIDTIEQYSGHDVRETIRQRFGR